MRLIYHIILLIEPRASSHRNTPPARTEVGPAPCRAGREVYPGVGRWYIPGWWVGGIPWWVVLSPPCTEAGSTLPPCTEAGITLLNTEAGITLLSTEAGNPSLG